MLVRQDPWSLMTRLQGDIDRILENRMRGVDDTSAGAVADWTPAVDIREEDNRFVLEADIPGIEPEDIEITMEDGVLTLKGRREIRARDEANGYRRIERVSGSFYRRFTLPDTADSEAIEARFNHGVLEVSIPKLPKVQPRRIDVKVS
ncbi:MAG: Hsp20/alpha crystallin family protein [Gammaproteobacteria bacterium]